MALSAHFTPNPVLHDMKLAPNLALTARKNTQANYAMLPTGRNFFLTLTGNDITLHITGSATTSLLYLYA